MDEGRVNNNNFNLQYVYDIKDHLGNVRVSFVQSTPAPEVVDKNFYYPFGLTVDQVETGYENKYKYNGKELEDDHNLNWYHYGARYYDPQLARWHTVDPIDELHSPYCYVANMPIRATDPDGTSIDIDENNAITGFTDDGSNLIRKTDVEGNSNFVSSEEGYLKYNPDILGSYVEECIGQNIIETGVGLYLDKNFETSIDPFLPPTMFLAAGVNGYISPKNFMSVTTGAEVVYFGSTNSFGKYGYFGPGINVGTGGRASLLGNYGVSGYYSLGMFADCKFYGITLGLGYTSKTYTMGYHYLQYYGTNNYSRRTYQNLYRSGGSNTFNVGKGAYSVGIFW